MLSMGKVTRNSNSAGLVQEQLQRGAVIQATVSF